MPENFEIWFISPNRTSFIKFPSEISYSSKIVQNDQTLRCEKFGDYCFDPQIGLYMPDKNSAKYKEVGDSVDIEKATKVNQNNLKSHLDESLINCDKNNFFDVFCGKEKGTKKKAAGFEVWIDTSSSLRTIDPTDRSGGCKRKSFYVALTAACKNKEPDLYTFNTSKRYTSNLDNLCLNYGLNDEKRLLRWIKNSNAKNLIVVTDIGEYTSRIADFIKENGGFARGTEVEEIVSTAKMVSMAESVAKYCK